MPAESKSQQRLMGMVHQCQKTGKCASANVKKIAKSMKPKDAKDFASTKHKDLPNKVSEKTITFREFILLETSDVEYEDFMKKVDRILERLTGFGHRDLEDWLWGSAFENKYTPEDAVNEFMEETGMDMF